MCLFFSNLFSLGHIVETEEVLSGRAEANQERKGYFSSPFILLPHPVMAVPSLQPNNQRREGGGGGGGGGTATSQTTGQYCIQYSLSLCHHLPPPPLQPLSLEEMMAKREEEAMAQSKVSIVATVS